MRKMISNRHDPAHSVEVLDEQDNPFIEFFNGSFRDEYLNVHWSLSLDDACDKIERCRIDDNRYRPHSSLGDITPEEFRDQHLEDEVF